LDIFRHEGFTLLGPEFPKPAKWGVPIVSSIAEYEALLPHMYLTPKLDDAVWEDVADQHERGEIVFWMSLGGVFWHCRTLLGIEPHLYAFYDKPELIRRISSDLAEWNLKAIEVMCRNHQPDFVLFSEDMSYNHGPMISEELFKEFISPYYRLVIPELKKNRIMPIVDSDGDITAPIRWFSEVGAEGFLPLERQAGVDVAKLRAMYPETVFIGTFNKMVMNKGEEALRGEFERLLPVAARGGLIIGCDHQTPPSVSYSDYKLYVRLFHEYAVKAGQLSFFNL
jgi:hypothetical protein